MVQGQSPVAAPTSSLAGSELAGGTAGPPAALHCTLGAKSLLQQATHQSTACLPRRPRLVRQLVGSLLRQQRVPAPRPAEHNSTLAHRLRRGKAKAAHRAGQQQRLGSCQASLPSPAKAATPAHPPPAARRCWGAPWLPASLPVSRTQGGVCSPTTRAAAEEEQAQDSTSSGMEAACSATFRRAATHATGPTASQPAHTSNAHDCAGMAAGQTCSSQPHLQLPNLGLGRVSSSTHAAAFA